jgi:hypothetical protein
VGTGCDSSLAVARLKLVDVPCTMRWMMPCMAHVAATVGRPFSPADMPHFKPRGSQQRPSVRGNLSKLWDQSGFDLPSWRLLRAAQCDGQLLDKEAMWAHRLTPAAGLANSTSTRQSLWHSRSVAGHCGATQHTKHHGCEWRDHGAFRLHASSMSGGWETLGQACALHCSACSRCRFISFSLRYGDCSWYNICNLTALEALPTGFRTIEVGPGTVSHSHRAHTNRSSAAGVS